jgi:DNA-directed RNA polymerase specialized sigma24 family protein
VIVLHELEGASVPDIAALLGVTRSTVRWHLSLGRHELRRIIESGGESGDR